MDAEIDILVNNFRRLWKSGHSAHLDLDTHAGEAWIGLRVRLGHARAGHQVHPQAKSRNSPSRQCRRIRRATARKQEADEATRNNQSKTEAEQASESTETKDLGEAMNPTKATVEVVDEMCDNREYFDAKVEDDNETESFEFECWDPANKWKIQDVYNHMDEELEKMFRVFKVESNDRQYKLNVSERSKKTFPFKIEIKKSKDVETVLNNFSRQGHVPGGGCVKFFRKLL